MHQGKIERICKIETKLHNALLGRYLIIDVNHTQTIKGERHGLNYIFIANGIYICYSKKL